MFILTRSVKLYTTKMITDLAMRTVAPTKESVAPFEGMNDVVRNYYNEETVASLEMLFEKQADFNADKLKPQISESDADTMEFDEFVEAMKETSCSVEYNPDTMKLDACPYYRRIEDLHQFYLRNYLGQVTYNVRFRSNGVKEFEREHQQQYAFISDGDNGEEITELSDLLAGPQVDMSDVSTVQEAMLNLPFTVKRLWSLSGLTNIHVLSYISAYLAAKRENDKALMANATTASLKHNDVIRYGVYKCNREGYILGKVSVENKNKWAVAMFDWITGQSDKWQSFYLDYRNFVIYCQVLNIDIINDDMTTYNKDFIKKLVIQTVTPNDQYNALVADAIKTGSTAAAVSAVKAPSTIEACVHTTNIYNDYCVSDKTEQQIASNMSQNERSTIKNIAQFIYTSYCTKYGYTNRKDVRKISWSGGFMYYDGDIVRIPLSFIHESLSCSVPELNYGLISETGYIIQITTGFVINRTMLLDAFNYLRYKGTHVEVSVPKWRRLTL